MLSIGLCVYIGILAVVPCRWVKNLTVLQICIKVRVCEALLRMCEVLNCCVKLIPLRAWVECCNYLKLR